LRVSGLLELLCLGTVARSLKLRQAGHVGIAQDEADVRVSDKPPLGAYHVGVPVLADLDLRDHIPNEL
jgi:hypothetical protein